MSRTAGARVPPRRGRRPDLRRARRPPTSSQAFRAGAAAARATARVAPCARRPTCRRSLVRRAPRTAAGGRVGAADRHEGPAPQLLPRGGQALLLQPRSPRARRPDRPRGGLHGHVVGRRRVPRLPAAARRSSWSRCRAARRWSTPRTPPRSSRWPTSSPARRVVEAGVGSGALTCSLLRAVGPARAGARPSSAARSSPTSPARNVTQFFGGDHPAWRLALGDLAEALPGLGRAGGPGHPRHARAVGVRRRGRRRRCCRAASCARTSPPRRSCPGSSRRSACTAGSPSRRPGSRWSATGTSRGSPSGPGTR